MPVDFEQYEKEIEKHMRWNNVKAFGQVVLVSAGIVLGLAGGITLFMLFMNSISAH